MSHEIGSDLRKWDDPSIAFFLKKRWIKHHVNPPGPGGVRVTEDNAFVRVLEDGITIRVTEGPF